MDFSAIVMLIFAIVVIFSGLYITINKAIKSTKTEKEE
ncbi:MAG: MetS family NSS transporter small subunit [Halanaerobiaceae bacterium]|nr:MetS family NSS transporter small subunit [Halanaerobiaceae bacterium]